MTAVKHDIPLQFTADSWGYTYDQLRTDEWGIPVLEPVRVDFSKYAWIGFNYATGIKPDDDQAAEYGVHFFVKDYIFKAIWNNMGRYTDTMSKFGCMTTPQFSAYLDYPRPLKLFNYYRSHAVGAYWQQHGLTVIPSMYLGQYPSEYEWCFEGTPKHGSVAVSTLGCGKSKALRKLFCMGFEEMMKQVEPYNILWYGEYFEECRGDIFQIPSYNAERWRGKKSDNTIVQGVNDV